MADSLAVVGTGSAAGVRYNKWISNGDSFTSKTSSDGKTKSWPGASDALTDKEYPPDDHYWCEKDTNHITTSGNPMASSESGAFEMKFAKDISDHFMMTSVHGMPDFDPSRSYCPIFDDCIYGIKFKYKKYDSSSRESQRFRMVKCGMICRKDGATGTFNGVERRDFTYPKPTTSSRNSIWMYAGGTVTGNVHELTRGSVKKSHIVGLYFQLATEGGSVNNTGGSYIKIWDLDLIISGETSRLILPKKGVYSSGNPPSIYGSDYKVQHYTN